MRILTAPRAIAALVLREISTASGRTPGGYIWAPIEPVAAVPLLALVFSLAFKAPPLGRDFALFYASGYLPFAFYSDVSQKIGVALRFSRPLMAYPAITWLDAIFARFLLNSLVNVLVATSVLVTLYYMSGNRPAQIANCALGFAIVGTFGLGIGVLNAFLFEIAPVWERLWAIVNKPAFVLSGVLFLPDSVPEPFHGLIWLNPIVHGISLFRSGIYGGYAPKDADPVFALFVAAVPLVLGLLLLNRSARDLLWQN